MNRFWYYILFLAFCSSCSVMNNERVYEGFYENDSIKIHFSDSKNGKLVVNNNAAIPFEYEIETSQIIPEMENSDNRKVKVYIYRFTVNADYNLSFPLGFYEIGQKGGDVLRGSPGLTLVRKRTNRGE